MSKSLLLIAALLMSQAAPVSIASPSALDSTANVGEFGAIRYRAPLAGSTGLPIVLFHGVYGGVTHRAYREVLPLLDAAGRAVWVMDLPGVGESDKPKRPYAIADLDRFVTSFLETVVREKATVVAESLTTLSALRVTADRPDLVRRLVILSPGGVNSLANPPSDREQRLYDRLYNGDDAASTGFYQNLLADDALRYFLRFAYFDDARVNEALLDDFRPARANIEQRWLTLSFVGGQLYRSFEDAARGVFQPVLVIFGKEYESFGDTRPTTAADVAAIRPDFTYVEVPGAGASVQREKPEVVAAEILVHATED